MSYTDFYDLKLLTECTAVNFNTNTDGEKFDFNDISVVKVEKSSDGYFQYKLSYKDPYKNVCVKERQQHYRPLKKEKQGSTNRNKDNAFTF